MRRKTLFIFALLAIIPMAAPSLSLAQRGGRGGPAPKSRAEVQAFRNKFDTVLKRAADAIKGGASKEQLALQVKTDDLVWQFQPNFYASLYDELTKGGSK